MIIEVIYIMICLLLAMINKDQISENKRINHALQGALHLGVGLICGVLVNWLMLPLILLTARIFFTSALNLMRDLPLDYVTPEPEALTDKVEQKIFGKNGKLPLIIYFVLYVLGNCFL